MSKERELLRAALDFLYPRRWVEQEPVAWIDPENYKQVIAKPQGALRYITRTPRDGDIPLYTSKQNEGGGCFLSDGNKYSEYWTALYTSPPKRGNK